MKMAQEQGLRWQKLLQYEHEQRLYLEDMVEQLGKQHSSLEKQIQKSMNGAIQPPDTAGLSLSLSLSLSVYSLLCSVYCLSCICI